MFRKRKSSLSLGQIQKRLNDAGHRPLENDGETFNRRKSKRLKAWAVCTLVWPPNGRARGVCVNYSETGARIRFSHRVTLPPHFVLVSARMGFNHECELVRQEGFDISVQFTGAPPTMTGQ